MGEQTRASLEHTLDVNDTAKPVDIAPRAVTGGARVALVNMPWARVDAPSVQCGLLKASLERAGHRVDVHYFNVDCAAALGSPIYAAILRAGTERQSFLGEWLFTAAAFGDDAVPAEEYLDTHKGMMQYFDGLEIGAAELAELHTQTLPAIVKHWLASVDWSDYDVVGFSSTFEQNVASFALAKAIKAEHPVVTTVFGGANFDGEMGQEYARVFPWIDVAVIGEGDITLPALVSALLSGSDLSTLPGLAFRKGGTLMVTGDGPRVRQLDDLPIPEYSEYFAAVDRVGERRLLGTRHPRLLIESARGCWWGQKHHCTFCGLNALGMDFRPKSPERVVEELTWLAERYQVLRIEAVDNIIDHASRQSLCDQLERSGYDFDLFYEVKANMTREDIATLKRAGINRIQPGIESLSTHVLELMRKGTSKLINIRIMKWALYYEVDLSWNILMGFPGETGADYLEQAELMKSLYHLKPPAACAPVWMERFSPYYTEPDAGFTNLKPMPAYRDVYPIPEVDLSKIAYFFDYEVSDVSSAEDREQMMVEVDAWRARWKTGRKPIFKFFKGPGWIRLIDNRLGPVERTTLDGERAAAFEHCSDSYRSIGNVGRHLGEQGYTMSELDVANLLDSFVSRRWAIVEGDRYLTLAMPMARPR